MIQDIRFASPEPTSNFVLKPNGGGSPSGAEVARFDPLQSSFASGQADDRVFPRNSWQSPDAQMRELNRGQELLHRPYNFRRHPGLDLFDLDDLVNRNWRHDPGVAQPVYGAPMDRNPPTAQPVYGAPSNREWPPAQPVYGAPSNRDWPPAQPVYGAPVNLDPTPMAPVYGGPFLNQ